MSALPGLGRTLVRGRRWQTSPVTGESSKETVKTIACGNVGRFRGTRCYSCAFYHYQVHTRPRVQRASGVPHALLGRKIHQRLGRMARRGREIAFEIRVTSLRRQAAIQTPSFRGDAQHRTRNLEIPGLRLTAHPGMTAMDLLAEPVIAPIHVARFP